MTRQPPPDVEIFPGPQADTAIAAGRCAWKGCAKHGEFPAPKDRRLSERYMFCLDHVRAYNAQWDFHQGLSADEMELELRGSSTWGRPTWKMGTLGGGRRPGGKTRGPYTGTFNIDDPFDLGSDTAFDAKRRQQEKAAWHGPSGTTTEEARALRLLGLALPLTLEALRRRYKALVKKYHPDANGGSAEAETRMKRINAAYQTLRATLAAAT